MSVTHINTKGRSILAVPKLSGFWPGRAPLFFFSSARQSGNRNMDKFEGTFECALLLWLLSVYCGDHGHGRLWGQIPMGAETYGGPATRGSGACTSGRGAPRVRVSMLFVRCAVWCVVCANKDNSRGRAVYGARELCEPEPWAPVSFLPYRSPHWCQKWDLNGHDGDRGMAQGSAPGHRSRRARLVRGTTQGPTGESPGWQRSTAPREPGCPGIPGQRRWSRTWRSSGSLLYTTAGMGTSLPSSLQPPSASRPHVRRADYCE